VTPTRARDLLGAAAVAAVLAALLLQLSYGDLPTLPPLAGTTLLAFAVTEAVLGTTLRARIQQRPRTRPVQALTAAKAVVLAKASSLAGAITGCAWLGVLSYVLPLRSQLQSAASDTVTASIGAVCAGALVAAGLWLEYCCRTPDGPEDAKLDR
jgi:DMSO reductase anchor subunit